MASVAARGRKALLHAASCAEMAKRGQGGTWQTVGFGSAWCCANSCMEILSRLCGFQLPTRCASSKHLKAAQSSNACTVLQVRLATQLGCNGVECLLQSGQIAKVLGARGRLPAAAK